MVSPTRPPTFDPYLAPTLDACQLFAGSARPHVGGLAKNLCCALAYSGFDAAARPVDQEFDCSEDMLKSFRSLDSVKAFLNGHFTLDGHREAVLELLKQVGADATTLATNLLIGCKNDEARVLLKDVLRQDFIQWSYSASPAEISGAFRSSGGWGLPVRNQLAVLADEIAHNAVTGCTDYTFSSLLFDSGVNHPTRTVRRLGDEGWQTETEQRSPRDLYEALVQLNASSDEHLKKAWSHWADRLSQPDTRALPSPKIKQLPTVDVPGPGKKLQSICQSGILKNIPNTLVSANDLTDAAIEHVLSFARVLEAARLRQWSARGPAPAPLLEEFVGRRALSVFDQPSTRSSLAVRDAMRLLGISVDEMIGASSSRGKGESLASELYTFAANGVDALFERASSAEVSAARRSQISGVASPVQVNMGGNLHHPTQTFADLLTIMEHYQCHSNSLQELREVTKAHPPTVVFYGRFTQKRADQALANFAMERLGWECVVVAPYEQDLPLVNSTIEHKYVLADKRDQRELLSIMQRHSAKILYMSNAEATADTSAKGTGQGKGEPATALALETLQSSGAFLMHPLPDSGELQTEIFGNPLFLGARQIVNKVYFTAAMTACMLLARD